MYYARIKCLGCPSKLYAPGPDVSVNNFEVHLKNRIHRKRVSRRMGTSSQQAILAGGASSAEQEWEWLTMSL